MTWICLASTSPRDDERSTTKGWTRGDTKKWTSTRSLKVTHHLCQYGIEIQVRRNGYRNGETRCYKTEGINNSTITFTLNDGLYRSINGSGKTFLPSTTSIKDTCHSVSRRNDPMLQHRGLHPETDAAIDWDTLLLVLCRDHGNAWGWTNHEWLDHLHRGSDKKIFQYCLDSDGFAHHLRVIEGHSVTDKVDPSLLDNVKISYMWSERIYHAGSSPCMYSYYPFRIDCRTKRYDRRKTNSFLPSRRSYD